MNTLLALSAVLTAVMVVGHGTVGRRRFFLPMLAADFDATSKRMMTFVWHMSTASLVVAAAALAYAAALPSGSAEAGLLATVMAVQFLGFGAVHLYLVVTSGLPGAVYKQFQWTLFLAVGVTAWAGA